MRCNSGYRIFPDLIIGPRQCRSVLLCNSTCCTMLGERVSPALKGKCSRRITLANPPVSVTSMKYFRLSVHLAVATISTIFVSIGCAQAPVEPGGWMVNMKLTTPNPITAKPIVIQESVSKMCFTTEFLGKDPFLNSRVDKENAEKQGYVCSVYDETRVANAASWRLECRLEGKATVSMDRAIRNTVSNDKLVSAVKQVISAEGRSVVTELAVESSFIGECTSEMQKP